MNRITIIAALVLALAVSLGINASQFLSRYRADIEAPLVQEITARKHADRVSEAVSKARIDDQRAIAQLQRELQNRQVETVTVYRDRIRQLPAPSCAPGRDRVEAWNTIALGEP